MANNDIEFDLLRVTMIDGNSEIMTKTQALSIARQVEMDLVLIAPGATPPVAKITSLNKHIYQLKQTAKEAKKKQRENKTELKEIRMGLNIDNHDLETKVNHARKFLNKNNVVTVTILLKGRERGKQDMARQLLAKFAELSESSLEKINYSGNRISSKLKC